MLKDAVLVLCLWMTATFQPFEPNVYKRRLSVFLRGIKLHLAASSALRPGPLSHQFSIVNRLLPQKPPRPDTPPPACTAGSPPTPPYSIQDATYLPNDPSPTLLHPHPTSIASTRRRANTH